MMKVLTAINLVLVIGLGSFYMYQSNAEKTGYVLTQRVFAEYKGKKDLEKKLSELTTFHKTQLDSISLHISQQVKGQESLIASYQQTAQTFELQEQELSAKYTADIWKRINQQVAEFAKQKGYDIVLGASGDGNLMYASEKKNITDEIVAFLNAN